MHKHLLRANAVSEGLKYQVRRYMRVARGLLVLMLLVSGCSPAGQVLSPTASASGANTPELSTSLASPNPAATLTAARSAEITEIHNDVSSRAESDDEFESAIVGNQLQVGGGVRTGDESRVRIDTSDGSIVRIASHTTFQLLDFSSQPVDPITKIGLTEGKLWVWVTQALGLGTFEIETPTGVATVRGSLMSVEYDATSGQMSVTCLEGICRLTDNEGHFTDLQAAEYSEIPAEQQPPTPPAPLTEQQLADWADNFPEATSVIATVTALLTAATRLSPTATIIASGTAGSPVGNVDCNLRSQSGAATEFAEITFVNQSKRMVKVYWLDWDGQEVLYHELEPGQSYTQGTYFTHPWCVRDANSGEALLAITATNTTQTAVIP